MTRPLAMGAAMGLMMLAMAHMALTGAGSGLAGAALAAFVGAHLMVALTLGAVALWGARRFPRLAARLHRPSLRHVAIMLGSAAVAAAAVHVFLHGVGL